MSRAVQDDFYNSPVHHRCWDGTLSVQIALSEQKQIILNIPQISTIKHAEVLQCLSVSFKHI